MMSWFAGGRAERPLRSEVAGGSTQTHTREKSLYVQCFTADFIFSLTNLLFAINEADLT